MAIGWLNCWEHYFFMGSLSIPTPPSNAYVMVNSVLKRNNVKISGKGSRTLLLAHGFGCDQQSWRFLTGGLEEQYKLVLFDYVGAGQSDLSQYNSEKYASLDGYAQDVLDICEALQLEDVIFIGHSVSSMIGLLAAIREPRYFKKMIFIGPSPRYLNAPGYTGGFEREQLEQLFESMENNYLGWSSVMAPAMMGNPDRPELGDLLTKSFCSTDPKIAQEFARVTFFSDNRNDLEKLTVDSLTLQCSDDIIAPVVVGEFILEHVSRNTFHQLRATGHCPHISEPAETLAAILPYINN